MSENNSFRKNQKNEDSNTNTIHIYSTDKEITPQEQFPRTQTNNIYSHVPNSSNDSNNEESCFKKNKILFIIFLLSLILILPINVFLFLKRIKLWVYFNDKKRTLPISYSNNTTFYITAMVVNMEKIIINYIEQMKRLIKYLGKENVIVSIVENGDSKDKTREFLEVFQNYLNENKISNKFILNHVIDDPRMKVFPFQRYSPLRIKFYSELRNKCFDLLY
jgi:hypothetical protein